jgi:hypothetical protein
MAKPGIAGVATVKVASGAANVRRFFAVVAGEPAANSSLVAICRGGGRESHVPISSINASRGKM